MALTESNVKVVGGQMNYRRLTSKVEQRIYDIGKAHIWLSMINDKMKPKKWNKPNTKGTKVTFDYIGTKEDLEVAFDEFEVYIKNVNRTHGTDLALKREGESEV
ncbi:hypothetical protein D3C74_353570 [compost metagenome]